MMIDVAASVRYCRDSKSPHYQRYVAVSGCGFSIVPARTRSTAELLLIGEIDERLFRAVTAFREMGEAYGRRALNGAKMYLADAVERFGDGYMVQSQSTPDARHFVYCDGLSWFCDCEDYEWGKWGARHSAPPISFNGVKGFFCKHIAAVGHYRLMEPGNDVQMLSDQ